MDYYLSINCTTATNSTIINSVTGGDVDPNCEYYTLLLTNYLCTKCKMGYTSIVTKNSTEYTVDLC